MEWSALNWTALLVKLDSFLWNGFLVYLLVGVGIFLTIRLKGMQFRYLPYSLKLAFSRQDEKAQGDISQFQALMIALAATIGTGTIAGMSTAIVAGGFGAVFWMWVVSLIGMVTKYAEAILAVKYRSVDHRGQMCGGPMYYITRGLGWKWLGAIFAIAGALAAFAGGNLIQSESIADSLYDLFHFSRVGTGIILAIATALVIMGGVKSLGKINAYLVPFMALFYVCGGLIILAMRFEQIPAVLALIVKSAFTGQAMVGGFLGAGVMAAIQMGIARGVSSNEAGLGSAPIAAAAAKTDLPGRQALISMTGVFFSSFLVCTITVLVLGVTGVLGMLGEDGKVLNGAPLVMQAFRSVIPGGQIIVAVGLLLFGFSTILGWAYYGEKCLEYLFGEKVLKVYRILFILVVFLGAISTVDIVWPIADIMNGFMALPNLIGLLFLSKIIADESNLFFKIVEKERKQQK